MLGFVVFLLVLVCIYLIADVSNLKSRLRYQEERIEDLLRAQKQDKGSADAAPTTVQEKPAAPVKEEGIPQTAVSDVSASESTQAALEAQSQAPQEPVVKKAAVKAATKVPVRRAPVQPAPMPKPAAKTPPVAAKPQIDLIGKLRSMGLWPPERKGGSSELVLMQWWMPRIGGVLAVLTLIFFGVYVSHGSPPWVKFTEMLASSFLVFGGGLYLEKKYKTLGSVLAATGLSMVYVSSVCGYALAAVRVVEHPVPGALMQLAALMLNFGVGSWKKNRSILLMSLVFGYISAGFAGLEGMREFALVASLAVFTAGILSWRRVGDRVLVVVSTVGIHLPITGLLMQFLFHRGAEVFPWPISVWVFLALAVSALPLCQWVFGGKDRALLPQREGRWLATINSTMALGFGYLLVKMVYRHSGLYDLVPFYGVMASVFIVWSLVWLFARREEYLFHLYWLKGSVLTSLFLVNYLSGDWHWVSLGLQVMVLSLSARRRKSWIMELLAGFTWVASVVYYLEGLVGDFELSMNEPLFWLRLGYLCVTSFAWIWMLGGNRQFLRWYRALYALPALLMFILWGVYFGSHEFLNLHEAPRMMVGALFVSLFFLIPKTSKVWTIGVASALFVLAHLIFWADPGGKWEALIFLGGTLLVAWSLIKGGATLRWAEKAVLLLFHALWLFTLWRYLDTFSNPLLLALAAPCLSLVLLLGANHLIKGLADVAWFPLFLWLVEAPSKGINNSVFCLFILLLLSAMMLPLLFPRVMGRFWIIGKKDLGNMLLHGLGFMLLVYWVPEQWYWFGRIWFWLLLCAGAFGLWYWKQHWVSWSLSILTMIASGVIIFEVYMRAKGGAPLTALPWNWQVMAAGIAVTSTILAIGAIGHIQPHQKMPWGLHRFLPWSFAIAAFGVHAMTFAYPPMQLRSFYTPTLAVFSMVLILIGIFNRNRAYRFVAMGTFVVPLVRLFAVDIKETLFRIIAFAVLAVLSVAVAYLYNKFAGRIDDEFQAQEEVAGNDTVKEE